MASKNVKWHLFYLVGNVSQPFISIYNNIYGTKLRPLFSKKSVTLPQSKIEILK